ncbi:cytochrome P450 [Auricularia subglabra TFB-10046 SS5]|nr:cytochrome P450 [Auricularia subglabra TFB-10046 SS5]
MRRAANGACRQLADQPEPEDLFIRWLRQSVERDQSGELKKPFYNDTIPFHINSLDALWRHLEFPSAPSLDPANKLNTSVLPIASDYFHALELFRDVGYPVDPACAADRTKWYYRTQGGECNWMEKGNSSWGQLGSARARDYDQHMYKDGISTPRDGPNARAVSNAFFRRKKRLYYEHTPVLLGLIEFIMHDVTYSEDSLTEAIEVPVPPDEDVFPLNTTFKVWRTTAVPGTGTSPENPRENANQATAWLDVSALYGSSVEVARALRSFDKGKLLASPGNYLPFNTMGLSMRTRPRIDPKTLFAGGDPRTNEDWIMLAVHTLLLRDHNRMCDLLAAQHPEYDDERIYQTIRLAMSAKFALIANSYQMAYWQTAGTDAMPWPRDDGFPLYRQMYGKSALEINAVHLYPWPLVTKGGKPMVASAEMAIVYRFHEFIIPSFPLKDADNKTIREKDLFESAFDSKGFVEAGLENILRGMVSTDIPNFKSGVDESFRSAGRYRGNPFDIVTWSIVPVRKRFEDFTSDPEMVAHLKRLYQHPDDVDLVVGCQLEEKMFPGTTVPSSALIISLFSLFGLGSSDRFSVGYAIMRCILVNKPWDCTPSNALEELFWDPKPTGEFPRARWLNTFWVTELDFQAHGTNLLWRLITENSDIDCLQQNPLFPYDPETNPVLCAVPPAKTDWREMLVMVVEVILSFWRQYRRTILEALGLIPATLILWALRRIVRPGQPPLEWKWPLFGVALDFKKNPTALVDKGLRKWGGKVFGLELANQRQFVITAPEDLQAIIADGAYEVRFSLHEFLRTINSDLIVGKENFNTDLHTKLIRTHLTDRETLKGFAQTVATAAQEFISRNPLAVGEHEKHYVGLNDFLDQYIVFVMSRCFVGPDGYDNADLLKLFLRFNDDAVNAMGLAALLPSALRFMARAPITKDWKAMRKILVPVIERRRAQGKPNDDADFLEFILPEADKDDDASDLVGFLVWAGLTNLHATLSSTVLDIINQPGLQERMRGALAGATLETLSQDRTASWAVLRSAAFESLRLSGPATGPARNAVKDFALPTEPGKHIPAGQAVALSAYALHRQPRVWGPDAAVYRADRFAQTDPDIGSVDFISWGLKTSHICPGRWFALQSIQIMVCALLEAYEFEQDRVLRDEEKYRYSSGFVYRNPVGVTVRARGKA